jgi:hypothetical protein
MMKHDYWKIWGSILFAGLLMFGFLGCAAMQPAPKAELQVIPDKTFLSPALFKKPIQFKGSGFGPKEMVVIEMVLPPGVKVKSVPEGENVGLAYATADERGNITAKMAPTATLNWFFQVGWTPNMKPDFKKARPLRPGKYEIVASGMDSGATGRSVLELVPPPKKKK